MAWNDYEIVRELAAGGMAMVSLARNRKSGGLVVLKRPLSKDPAIHRRLRDEGRIGLTLQHPALVKTVEVFEHEGEPVVVVGFFPGASLTSLRPLAPHPIDVVAWIGYQISLALNALHQARDADGNALEVVHRDVTEGNVLLGIDGQPFLIDLGIARWAGDRETKTQTGAIPGTLRFLSPELLAGESQSPAADFWALGLVLLQAALGKTIFRGSTTQIIMSISKDSPMDFEGVDELPKAFTDVVGRLLHRDPKKRLTDGMESAALFAAIFGNPVVVREKAAEIVLQHQEEKLELPEPPGTSETSDAPTEKLAADLPEFSDVDTQNVEATDRWMEVFADAALSEKIAAPNGVTNVLEEGDPEKQATLVDATIVAGNMAQAPEPADPDIGSESNQGGFKIYRPPVPDAEEIERSKKRAQMATWGGIGVLVLGLLAVFGMALISSPNAKEERPASSSKLDVNKKPEKEDQVPEAPANPPPKNEAPKEAELTSVVTPLGPNGFPTCYREGKTRSYKYALDGQVVTTDNVNDIPKIGVKKVTCIDHDDP